MSESSYAVLDYASVCWTNDPKIIIKVKNKQSLKSDRFIQI